MNEEEYIATKSKLTLELLKFVENYEGWETYDKNKIVVNGLSFAIGALSEELISEYDNNVGYYLDKHTTGRVELRTILCDCIKYN